MKTSVPRLAWLAAVLFAGLPAQAPAVAPPANGPKRPAAPAPAARPKAGLEQLRAEMKKPSPPDRDRSKPSGHDWALAQIVAKLAAGPLDRKVLAEELKFSHPGEFQTCLRILLLRAGDRSQVEPLRKFLQEPGPFALLREQALIALEPTRDRGSVDAVWKVAAQDPYFLVEEKVADPQGKQPPGPGMVYPVRKKALEVLRAWKAAGVPMSSYVQRTLQENRYQFRQPARPATPPAPARRSGSE